MKLTARISGVLLSVLLVVGLGLRLAHLDQRSMWTDELFTLAIAQYHPLIPPAGQPVYRQIQVMEISDADTFLTAKAAEQSPPLNDLLVKATLSVLGPTEIAARLPAALLASALLVWLAVFAWRQPDPYLRRVLHWSLFLQALYPALLMYAQEGRAYSPGVSLIGMGGLLWMLRWKDGWRNWQPPGWTEVLLLGLACFTHYNATLLVALLLLPDGAMSIQKRSAQGVIRLVTLGALVMAWIALNAHAIFFTASGGVAWATTAKGYAFVQTAVPDALATLHAPWLGLAVLLMITMMGMNFRSAPLPAYLARPSALRLYALGALTLAYLILAGKVAEKAGMEHPRYYIFIIPFVAFAIALVLAEIRSAWGAVAVALAFATTAPASERLEQSYNTDDFRSMAMAAASASDSNTAFLYPLPPLRDVYRVYLHRYLGVDPMPRMVEIGSEQDIQRVCEQLKTKTHVVALGHAWGQSIINTVYESCGRHWRTRSAETFHNTFVEHWQTK